MPRRFEADQHTSSDKIRQHPIPYWRCSSLVCCFREDKLGGLETVRSGDGYGQPDYVQEKVQHNYACGESENGLVGAGVKVIHADRNEEKNLGHDPLERAELDVRDIGGKIQTKDCNFRK